MKSKLSQKKCLKRKNGYKANTNNSLQPQIQSKLVKELAKMFQQAENACLLPLQAATLHEGQGENFNVWTKSWRGILPTQIHDNLNVIWNNNSAGRNSGGHPEHNMKSKLSLKKCLKKKNGYKAYTNNTLQRQIQSKLVKE